MRTLKHRYILKRLEEMKYMMITILKNG